MSSIKKNFAYQAFYEIFIIIMPFLTSPYIARVLGAESIGIYSYTYSMAYYFVLFGMLGINNYGNRLISSVRDNKEKLNKEFSSLLIVHIFLALIVLGVYIIYCIYIVDLGEKQYAYIQLFFVASAIFDINWLFFGLEEFKLSVTRNTIIKIISILCIFCFVHHKSDLNIYCFIMSFGIFCSQLALWPFLKRYVRFKCVSFHDILKHVKPLMVLFIPVLAVSIYKIMDKIMLGFMDTRTSLGYYENSEKIVSVFITAVSSFGTVMLPRMNNLFANGNEKTGMSYLSKSLKWMPIITYVVTFGVIGVSSNFVILFWGEDFTKCAPVLSVLIISLPIVAIASVIRMQFLIPNKRDKEYIISVCGGAIVNLIVNYLLIPNMGPTGAAIGTVFAELFVCLYQALSIKSEVNVFLYLRFSIPYLGLSIIMMLFVITINKILNASLIIKLLIQIVSGAIIFVLGFILIYPDKMTLRNFYHKCCKKYES